MKNKIIIGVVSMALCTPAMANIDKNASTATCDSATIGATNGTAKMDTAWIPNTINLDWYNGDVKQTSTTCTYDGAITLPSNPSPKTGYTFAGWKVKTNTNQCDISGWVEYHIMSRCSVELDAISAVSFGGCAAEYGLTEPGQWAQVYYTGVSKGRAVCSSTEGVYNELGRPNENSKGNYCWCHATHYIPNGGDTCNVESLWQMTSQYVNTNDCEKDCAFQCSDDDFIRWSVCPNGATLKGDTCVCQSGNYDSANWRCVVCNGSSTWNGSECACQAGYEYNGNDCVSVCKGSSSWNGTNCACESGYTYDGIDCVELAISAGVYLVGNTNKMNCIKAVKAINGMGIAAAKTFVESATPSDPKLIEGATGADIDTLTANGCTVISAN